MIRRWPIAGEMSIECATGNVNGVHARCKSTRSLCSCDCHVVLARLSVVQRQADEMEWKIARIESFLEKQNVN